MKKILMTILVLILLIGAFAGCRPAATPQTDESAAVQMQKPAKTTASPEGIEAFDVLDSKITLWKSSIGTIWGQLIVEVKNTGTTPLYLTSSDFDLENEIGEPVDVMKVVGVYPSIIMPGEMAVYCNQTTMDKVTDETMQLKAVHRIQPKKAKNDQILFPASDVSVEDSPYGGISAIGQIENNTAEEQKMVYVAVVCRDENEKVVTVLTTILMDAIAPGETVWFEATALSLPDNITADQFKTFETYAYPLQMQI